MRVLFTRNAKREPLDCVPQTWWKYIRRERERCTSQVMLSGRTIRTLHVQCAAEYFYLLVDLTIFLKSFLF